MNIDKYIDALYYEEFEKYDDDYDFEWDEWKEKECKKRREPKFRCVKYPVCPKHYPQQYQSCQCPAQIQPRYKCHIDKNRKASETWIPYASGADLDLTIAAGGTTASAAVGFGSSGAVTVATTLGTINLVNGSNFAFAVPREGCLRSFTAYLTVTGAIDATLGLVTVYAQLYRAEAGSTLFTPIQGATITFPAISSTTAAGTTFNGIIKGINYPLCEQDRLLLVYSATSTTAAGADPITIPVTASAGISIA